MTPLKFAKPESRKRTKARRVRQQSDHVHQTRAYVFARERDICRCCRARAAHSMHEIVPRSLGGKVSKFNSIAVCGSGTTLCHGLLQQHQIECQFGLSGAEDVLGFTPKTEFAATHMKLALGEQLLSAPMRVVEVE